MHTMNSRIETNSHTTADWLRLTSEASLVANPALPTPRFVREESGNSTLSSTPLPAITHTKLGTVTTNVSAVSKVR